MNVTLCGCSRTSRLDECDLLKNCESTQRVRRINREFRYPDDHTNSVFQRVSSKVEAHFQVRFCAEFFEQSPHFSALPK